MRQAHPRHRYRTRRAIGPALVALVAAAVVLAATGGSGLGRNAPPGGDEGAVSGVATRDRSAAQGDDVGRPSDATADALTARVAAGSAPGASPSLPPVFRTGAEPRADRRPIVLPDLESSAVARVGRGATAVFLGDSFTSGWNGAGLGPHGWPALVGAARGWKVVNMAVPGTGYINPGWTNQPLGSRIGAAVRRAPAIVFVATGHNDSRWSTSATIAAAERAIDRLHAGLPDAMIVIVAPIWQNGSPPSRCLDLRDALRRKAAAIGATFIDPLAERWFAGDSHRYIGSDGLHPTNAGHAWLARRILADLARI